MLERSRVVELEEKYGNDEALAVRYDEEEGVSLLPDGRRASLCTDCARFIRDREPGTTIVGFLFENNPTAAAAELAGGHDFAIVDSRYIVDPWIVETIQLSKRAVFDLENPLDQSTIGRLYGDRRKWALVEPPSEMSPSRAKESRVDERGGMPSLNLTRVIAAVATREERFLVCQRPRHKRHGGLWEFPGGKLEPGESDFDAARRELAEELDVRVTGIGSELFSVQDPGSEFVIAFVSVMLEGEPKCLEHLALRWCDTAELFDLPLAPSDRRFVETMLRPKGSD